MKEKPILILQTCILIFLLCCWGCYEDSMENPDQKNIRQGQLTIEEARDLFKDYASSRPLSRSLDLSRALLDPGIITPNWEEATRSDNGVNSYVSVPVQATNTFRIKSPKQTKSVRVSQKLIVVQEDTSRRNSVYLLSLIPEGDFANTHEHDISGMFRGGSVPKGYSGLIVYTLLQGGLPLYVASFREGQMLNDIFIFDKRNSVNENASKLNSLLADYPPRNVAPHHIAPGRRGPGEGIGRVVEEEDLTPVVIPEQGEVTGSLT